MNADPVIKSHINAGVSLIEMTVSGLLKGTSLLAKALGATTNLLGDCSPHSPG